MSIEKNKRIVEKFCSLFSSASIDELLQMMSDDATWWTNGKVRLFTGAGLKSRSEISEIWRELYLRIDGGLQMQVIHMVAEGDYVAAELISNATTVEGRRYNNGYHMLFIIKDEKIVEVKEYTDLLHTLEIFGQRNPVTNVSLGCG